MNINSEPNNIIELEKYLPVRIGKALSNMRVREDKSAMRTLILTYTSLLESLNGRCWAEDETEQFSGLHPPMSPFIGIFRGYEIKYRHYDKNKYLSLVFSHIAGIETLLEKCDVPYSPWFEPLGELREGDLLYFEGMQADFYRYGQNKNLHRIRSCEKPYLLSRDQINPYPKDITVVEKGYSRALWEKSYALLLDYINENHPDASKTLDSDWDALIAEIDHKYKVGTALYSLINPVYSSSLGYEVNDKPLIISALEARDRKPFYIVHEEKSGRKLLIDEKLIDKKRIISKQPLKSYKTLFFTDFETAKRRAAALNEIVDKTGVLECII